MKKLIAICMLVVLIVGLATAATTTCQVDRFTYTITNKTAGVKVQYNQWVYTNQVRVICYVGQVFVEPNRVDNYVVVDGVKTSRTERVYLLPTNTLQFTYYGPKEFTVGNTNASLNTYVIDFD